MDHVRECTSKQMNGCMYLCLYVFVGAKCMQAYVIDRMENCDMLVRGLRGA